MPIARTRDREILTPAATSAKPTAIKRIGIRPTGSRPIAITEAGTTATTAGKIATPASGRALSQPVLSAAPSAPQPRSPQRQSAALNTPAGTGSSARPEPGSEATTVGSIFASKKFASSGGKGGQAAAFSL